MLPEEIELIVVTPERQLLRETVVEVTIPGRDGALGILPGHAPLMTELGHGELSYQQGTASQPISLAIHRGFAEVLPDRAGRDGRARRGDRSGPRGSGQGTRRKAPRLERHQYRLGPRDGGLGTRGHPHSGGQEVSRHATGNSASGLSESSIPAIVIYSTPWCPDCFRVKRFLAERGVAFREIDIEDDPDAEDLVIRVNHGKRKVPTLKIGERYIASSPFRAQKLAKNWAFHSIVAIKLTKAGGTEIAPEWSRLCQDSPAKEPVSNRLGNSFRRLASGKEAT